jgi:murein DD-endopeptidase MepM/ murein hydrolase activator NlpD
MTAHRRAPLRLSHFPIEITASIDVSFINDFLSPRPHGTIHHAIDIHAPEGTWIRSAVEGTVLNRWLSGSGRMSGVDYNADGGNIAAILDDEGYVHYYAHMLAPASVRPGQRVRGGQRIGQVSNTGLGGPKHLHYQVWPVGHGREDEIAALIFNFRFAAAVNPHAELCRLVAALGVTVARNGSVHARPSACGEGPAMESTWP